jgi:hypothetical protein
LYTKGQDTTLVCKLEQNSLQDHDKNEKQQETTRVTLQEQGDGRWPFSPFTSTTPKKQVKDIRFKSKKL